MRRDVRAARVDGPSATSTQLNPTPPEQPANGRPRTLCGGGPVPNLDDAGLGECLVPYEIRGPLGPTNDGWGGVVEGYDTVGDFGPVHGTTPPEEGLDSTQVPAAAG